MSMQLEGITSRGQLLAFNFSQSDVAASQSAVAMNVAEVRDTAATADDVLAVTGYYIPFDYEIVAVTASASTAATGGTALFQATIDGTAQTSAAVTIDSATAAISQKAAAKIKRDTVRGAYNTVLGVKLTTPAGWTPITADVVCTVYIIARINGI